MWLTTAEVVPLTALGTLTVSFAGQWLTGPVQRRHEARAEAAEQRRDARRRGHQAAEHAQVVLNLLDAVFDVRRRGPVPPSADEVEAHLTSLEHDAMYIPHPQVRERLRELIEVIAWRDLSAQFGGPQATRTARAAVYELRETFGEWLRTGELHSGAGEAAAVCAAARDAVRAGEDALEQGGMDVVLDASDAGD